MVYWPEMTPNSNPDALGRFLPGPVDIGDVPGGSTQVTIKTNLAGEPVRFTYNESFDNIVYTANLVLINAKLGDNNEIISGVMGPTPTEEDEAKWGTYYREATVEPNQYVEVWELRGPYTELLDGDDEVFGYDTADDDNMCYSQWRVIDVTSYTDENDVPYYEVNLESTTQKLVEAKIDPQLMGSNKDWIVWIERNYYEDIVYYADKYMGQDGYNGEYSPAELHSIYDGCRIIYDESMINLPDTEWEHVLYLGLWPHLIAYAREHIMDFQGYTAMSLEEGWSPASKQYNKGDNFWDALTDVLAFNGLMARFEHVHYSGDLPYLMLFDPANPSLGQFTTRDIGDFGIGVKYAYSKAGVCDTAIVTGYVGVKDADGHWIPFVQANNPTGDISDQLQTKVTVTLAAATNILNGEHVEMMVDVDADHWLTDLQALRNYGTVELYKTVLSARSASYEAEGMSLALMAGDTITGTSAIGGTTSILVTSFSRTTDVQLGTIVTSISGTVSTQTDAVDETDIWWI